MKKDMKIGTREKSSMEVHCGENTVGHEAATIGTREETGLKGMRELFTEEEGMGTVEIILIVVVLVGLVIIFKDQITKIVNNLFDKISTQTGRI